jgi:PEP-CTERM motif
MKKLTKTTLMLAGVASLYLMSAGRADAALIVLAPGISSVPGGSGTFDIVLQNTGASGIGIGGFSIGITTPNSAITFTTATTGTSVPYIFAGDSLFGPNLTITSGTSLTASDNPAIASFFTVGAGSTVGLAHIAYSIAGNSAPGVFAITLSSSATSLADAEGFNVPINTLTNGSINITSATPEPASLALVGLALLVGISVKKHRA